MKRYISKICAWGSLSIGTIITIMILDIPMKFIPFIRIPMDVYFFPLYTCPIGIILSIISLLFGKNKIAIAGLIINLLLFMLEAIFLIMGLRFLMH